MLRIVHIEELETHALQLPGLIRQQSERASSFASNADNWLRQLEALLEANKLYQAANIAVVRSELIAAMHGQVPNGLQFRGLPTRSRVVATVASQALQRATDVLMALLNENRPRLVEGQRIAQQVVAAGASRGLVPDQLTSNTEYLGFLRRSLAQSADLQTALIHLDGLVGPHDTLILLDRALGPVRETFALSGTSMSQ